MDDDEEEINAVVIDNGSGTFKIGLAGDELPKAVFTSIVGRQHGCNANKAKQDICIGEEAQKKRDLLSLRYPMEHGIITNWDDMEKVWEHGFSKLHVDPTNQPILMTDASLNPKMNREKMCQVMFEKYNAPAFYVSIPSTLAMMYSCRRTTGVIIDIGDGVTQVVPFYDAFVLTNAITRLDFGGRDLTDYLMALLSERRYSFCTSSERELVRDIKENLCYVASDFNVELQKFTKRSTYEKKYTLPNGGNIVVGNEMFRCAEALFKPSLIGINSCGIHEIVNNCIKNCDVDVRKEFYSNIVLSGGTTLFPGIIDRLQSELSHITNSRRKIHINAPSERMYSVWIGGSLVASLFSFDRMWITRKEYDEHGPALVHKKCL